MKIQGLWPVGVFALLSTCGGGSTALGNNALLPQSTPNSIRVSVSGEQFAVTGYPYTQVEGNNPDFVDGWQLTFSEYFVSLANPHLNLPPTDPSIRQNVGALVAAQPGPWIIDIHTVGSDVGAAGPPQTAQPLFTFTQGSDGTALDPTVRYAFGFDMVPASSAATLVGVGAAQMADVQYMIAHGYTTFLKGTATYMGRPSTATVDPTFQQYPTTVNFNLWWAAPASYINCHNPLIGEADIPANRGVQPSPNGSVMAEMMIHIDHFYWDIALDDEAQIHWDALAARANQGSDGTWSMTIDDLMGDDYSAPTDIRGNPVMDRGAQTTGYTGSGPLVYQLGSATGVTDLRSFLVSDARTQGHMNAEGNCYVQPNGPITF